MLEQCRKQHLRDIAARLDQSSRLNMAIFDKHQCCRLRRDREPRESPESPAQLPQARRFGSASRRSPASLCRCRPVSQAAVPHFWPSRASKVRIKASQATVLPPFARSYRAASCSAGTTARLVPQAWQVKRGSMSDTPEHYPSLDKI